MVVLNKKAGFTLIELLVVISIIATLMAVLLPNFMGARERASDSKKKQELTAIKNALRLFYNDTQNYPPIEGSTPQTQLNLGNTLVAYMPNINEIGFTYDYYQTDTGDGFQLCSVMDSGGEDASTSQARCKDAGSRVCGSPIMTNLNLYVVCAN